MTSRVRESLPLPPVPAVHCQLFRKRRPNISSYRQSPRPCTLYYSPYTTTRCSRSSRASTDSISCAPVARADKSYHTLSPTCVSNGTCAKHTFTSSAHWSESQRTRSSCSGNAHCCATQGCLSATKTVAREHTDADRRTRSEQYYTTTCLGYCCAICCDHTKHPTPGSGTQRTAHRKTSKSE
jgi:hypothetical protein